MLDLRQLWVEMFLNQEQLHAFQDIRHFEAGQNEVSSTGEIPMTMQGMSLRMALLTFSRFVDTRLDQDS